MFVMANTIWCFDLAKLEFALSSDEKEIEILA